MSRRAQRRAAAEARQPKPEAAQEPEPSGYLTQIGADGKPSLMAYWHKGVLPDSGYKPAPASPEVHHG